MSLLSIFAGSVLPIVTIAAVGITLGRVRSIAVEPLNTVTIYVLTPALVFHSVATSDLGGETLLKIVGGVVAFALDNLIPGTDAERGLDDWERTAEADEDFLSAYDRFVRGGDGDATRAD